jgi:CRP/FNR family transcriptional regulator, cyclic AMP receptor protein
LQAMTINPTAVKALKNTPIFGDLSDEEIADISRLFKKRKFAAGETVVREGLGGAAFFVIETGEADVLVEGELVATLSGGDCFGEIALFDEGTRTATITAKSDLVCYGLTYWDFRPLVEKNGIIGWKLLQRMARFLRETRGH